jgi:integrase
MAQSTAAEYERQIEKHIRPKLGKKKIASVTKADIEKALKPLPPVLSNRVHALLSSLFTLFEHWEYRPQHSNPVRGIEKVREEARDRTLSHSELAAMNKALGDLEGKNPQAILAIRLAAFTGLRIGEVIDFLWENIDLERSVIVLHETKNDDKFRSN